MKLPGMLLKAGLASAGAGIYLYVRKLFKVEKKTKKEPDACLPGKRWDGGERR